MGALFSLFSMWGLNTWHRNIVVGIIIILVVMLDQRKQIREVIKMSDKYTLGIDIGTTKSLSFRCGCR